MIGTVVSNHDLCKFTSTCRLGEVEKAMYHYKHAGAESDPDVLTKAKNLQVHLSKCTEAKQQRDWNTVLKETRLAISAGADSAPQVSHGVNTL